MSRQSVIKGALILSIAGFSVRFIGLGLKMVLNNYIGPEGLGLYGAAYPIYEILLALSSAGIPLAISKLISEHLTVGDYRGANKIFRTALSLIAISGLLVSILAFLAAPYLAEYIMKDSRAYYPIIAIAPAIFITTVMACFRGYFQGQQLMVPTAVSQIIEQIFRVGTVLVLVTILLPNGLEFAVAGATFGAVTGALAGLLVLLLIFVKTRRKLVSRMSTQKVGQYLSKKAALHSILALSIPITVSHLVNPLQSVINLFTVHFRLEYIGMDVSRRTELYGQLNYIAAPIAYIPQIMTTALAISLLPAISEASALNNKQMIRFRASLALRFSILLGLPSAVGLYILATPITMLLFQNQEAGTSLAYLSLTVLFFALYQTSSTVLQGLGKTNIPLYNMIIGMLTKVVCNWFLVAIPVLHINGAAIGSVIGFLIASALNLYRLCSLTGLKFNSMRAFIKPMVSASLMGLAVYLTYKYSLFLLTEPIGAFSYMLSNTLSVMISVVVGIGSYGIALFILKVLDKDDLLMIPRYGPLILRVALKLRLLKQEAVSDSISKTQ